MLNSESIVYNADCMDIMKSYPDKYFDLAVVDPPYGIGEDGSKNNSRGKLAKAKNYKAFAGNDLSSPNIEYFNELIRISKNQIIFGSNHFISKIPYDSSCWIVWDKNNAGNDFADCELAYTSFKTAVRKFKFTWNGMLQQNMKNKEIRIHPTQKPVALYDWIFKNYAKPTDKILDTHLGSGSSRIAAYKSGLSFVGIELDKDYFEAQEKRFNTFKSQLRLF
jgi:site-specific DNA-methyltransferase (adenine-specific)